MWGVLEIYWEEQSKKKNEKLELLEGRTKEETCE